MTGITSKQSMFRKKLHGVREGSICIYGMTWKSTSRKKSFFPITGHSLLSYHRTVHVWNICQVCIYFIYIFTDTCSLSSSLSFTATGTTCTLNMLLQHGTVRSIFLPLQKGTSALVQKQHLHSENISLLHGVKERSSGTTEMAEITRQDSFISCYTLPKGICWQGICKSRLVNNFNAPWYYSDIIICVPVQIQPGSFLPVLSAVLWPQAGSLNLLPSFLSDTAHPLLPKVSVEGTCSPGVTHITHYPSLIQLVSLRHWTTVHSHSFQCEPAAVWTPQRKE